MIRVPRRNVPERPGGIDVPTNRKMTMDQSDASFRDLVERAECMIVILRPDRTIAYFNAFATEMTGYEAEDVLGKPYFELLVPQPARAEVEKQFQRVLSGSPGRTVEHPLQASGAPLRWVECHFRPFGQPAGQPAVLMTAQDITVRKHTEQTLRKRTHDLGERIKELNCLFGLSKLVEEPDIDLEGIFQGLVDIIPPSWQYPAVTCARVLFENKEFKTYNFKKTCWKQAAPLMVFGSVAGALEVYYLEEKPEEREGPFLAEERRLLNAVAERLGNIAERRQLEREISEISTKEQQRLGQELHDGLGQELTGLGYLAEKVYRDLQARGAPETETANELAECIQDALDQARAITRGLVPVDIDAHGLPSALEQLASSTQQRCGIACRFHAQDSVRVEDTPTATQLFRIVQEAVNNAVKHSQARKVAIAMTSDGKQVTFQVRDDGVGIREDLDQTAGMGLRIMHYRANVIGASLSVGPADGGGTLVTCSIVREGTREHHDGDRAENG